MLCHIGAHVVPYGLLQLAPETEEVVKQRKLSNRGRHRCSLPGSGGSSTPTSAPVTIICGWCSPSLLPFSSVLAAGLLLLPAPLLLLLLNRPRSPCTAGVRTSSNATAAQAKAARPMEFCNGLCRRHKAVLSPTRQGQVARLLPNRAPTTAVAWAESVLMPKAWPD
jgi:hypothetical protein